MKVCTDFYGDAAYNRRMAPTPQQKGDQLENAVRGIENLLLSLSPSLTQETYKIESKKIISVGEVRHEIDVFVSVDLGSDYSLGSQYDSTNFTGVQSGSAGTMLDTLDQMAAAWVWAGGGALGNAAANAVIENSAHAIDTGDNVETEYPELDEE
jgi:hypothetical protein